MTHPANYNNLKVPNSGYLSKGHWQPSGSSSYRYRQGRARQQQSVRPLPFIRPPTQTSSSAQTSPSLAPSRFSRKSSAAHQAHVSSSSSSSSSSSLSSSSSSSSTKNTRAVARNTNKTVYPHFTTSELNEIDERIRQLKELIEKLPDDPKRKEWESELNAKQAKRLAHSYGALKKQKLVLDSDIKSLHQQLENLRAYHTQQLSVLHQDNDVIQKDLQRELTAAQDREQQLQQELSTKSATLEAFDEQVKLLENALIEYGKKYGELYNKLEAAEAGTKSSLASRQQAEVGYEERISQLELKLTNMQTELANVQTENEVAVQEVALVRTQSDKWLSALEEEQKAHQGTKRSLHEFQLAQLGYEDRISQLQSLLVKEQTEKGNFEHDAKRACTEAEKYKRELEEEQAANKEKKVQLAQSLSSVVSSLSEISSNLMMDHGPSVEGQRNGRSF